MSFCCFFSLTLPISQTLKKVVNIKMGFLLGTFWQANHLLLTFIHLSPEMFTYMEDWGTGFPAWPSALSIHCYSGTRPPWKCLSYITHFFPPLAKLLSVTISAEFYVHRMEHVLCTQEKHSDYPSTSTMTFTLTHSLTTVQISVFFLMLWLLTHEQRD